MAAESAGVSYDAMKLESDKAYRRRVSREKKKEEAAGYTPARQQQPRVKGVRYDDVRSAMAEEGLLRLLVKEPALFAQTPLAPEELSVPLFQRVYAALRERYETGTPVTLGALETQLTGEEMAHLSAVMNKDDQLVNEDALRDYVGVIRQQYARRNQEGGGALLEMARRLKEKKGYGG